MSGFGGRRLRNILRCLQVHAPERMPGAEGQDLPKIKRRIEMLEKLKVSYCMAKRSGALSISGKEDSE